MNAFLRCLAVAWKAVRYAFFYAWVFARVFFILLRAGASRLAGRRAAPGGDDPPSFRVRAKTAASAAVCVSCTLFFFGPLRVYYGNVLDIPFTAAGITPYLLGITLACAAALAALLLACGRRFHRATVAVVLAIAACLWFQGNVLVRKYGALDGRDIDWAAMRVYEWADLALWAAVVAAALRFRREVYRTAAGASLALVLIQAITLGIDMRQAPEEPSFKRCVLDMRHRFDFSAERNVIVLVLDEFQGDIFQELLLEDPSCAAALDGFTYFRNAVGGFPSTAAAIPLIMTGRYYENREPFQAFLREAFTGQSIPKVLRAHGFDVEYADRYYMPAMYVDDTLASNVRMLSRAVGPKGGDLGLFLEITAFRYLPNHLKKKLHRTAGLRWARFTRQAEEVAGADTAFVRRMASSATARRREPVFRYFHWAGVHPPLTLDEQLRRTDMPYNRANVKRQARAELKLVGEFIGTLKRLGVYDKTLLLVIADHGAMSFEIPEGSGIPAGGGPAWPVSGNRGTAIPLILAKGFGARGALRISDSPVCLADIPATVAAGIGIDAAFPGRPLGGFGEGETRERRFLEYSRGDLRMNNPYFPPMREYLCSGFSWLGDSWRPTGRYFISGRAVAAAPPVYRYGSVISFGASGGAGPYLYKGWSGPEKGGRWTNGKRAFLAIPVRPSKTGALAAFAMSPIEIPGAGKGQRVGLVANGRGIVEWDVAGYGVYRAVIPRAELQGPVLELALEMPDAVVPMNHTRSADRRMLGLFVRSFSLSPRERLAPGSRIRFGRGGNSGPYLIEGWSYPEDGFTWTDGKRASLSLEVPRDGGVVLRAHIKPMAKKGAAGAQRVFVTAAGVPVGEGVIRREGEYGIAVPPACVRDGTLELTMELPDAVSPAELYAGADTRALGLQFYRLQVEKAGRRGG